MKDVMLDLETLGNGKNAAICQIGACYFDRATGEIGATLKINVDVASAVRSGADLDGETVYWWLGQSDAARASILADPKVDITEAMVILRDFLQPAAQIWSHATFDFVCISETYRRLGLKFDMYRKARDIRTLVDLARLTVDKTDRTTLHHDALEDCLHQVKYCVKAFNTLNRLKLLGPALQKFIIEDGEPLK